MPCHEEIAGRPWRFRQLRAYTVRSLRHVERVSRHQLQSGHGGLARCQIEHVTNRLARQVNAAAATSRRVRKTDALKARWFSLDEMTLDIEDTNGERRGQGTVELSLILATEGVRRQRLELAI
jgi:hypothetical protein